jgi:hypothetical protein
VTLAFLDGDGNEIRSYASGSDGDPPRVPAAVGMNRFVWNLRYPGAAAPTAEDLQPWERPDGPMIVPGTYRARLSVDGCSQAQEFEVLPDPRIETGAEDLVAQRDLLLQIRDSLSSTNETIDRIDATLAQIAAWQKRLDDPAVRDAAEAVTSDLRAMRCRLIDVNMKQSQLWPSGLHEKFNALLDSVDGADYAPPRQARDVYAELVGHLDGVVDRLREVEATTLVGLNDAIKATGRPPVELAG